MRFSGVVLIALCGCGGGSGKLYARISSDPALAAAFTTEDGWTLQFTHVVVAVSSFSVTGNGSTAFPVTPAAKVVDFSQATKTDLGANLTASPQTFDSVTLVLGRSSGDTNVNVPSDVFSRMGSSTVWVEGTATRQSTTRTFELGLGSTVAYDSCMPPVNLEPASMATVDYRVHAQRLFFDDLGKLRFDAFGLSDAAPADGLVINAEAAAVMTSTLPAAQYGATGGTLINVLEKRERDMVGLGDMGTCSGR